VLPPQKVSLKDWYVEFLSVINLGRHGYRRTRNRRRENDRDLSHGACRRNAGYPELYCFSFFSCLDFGHAWIGVRRCEEHDYYNIMREFTIVIFHREGFLRF
jgi:hypothetical protein